MRILVTGGAGYIGSAITKALLEQGHQVTVFDDLSSGQLAKVPKAALIETGDITDLDRISTVVSAGFDVVVHCAAKKSVAEGQANPALYFKTNVGGTINLLTAMELYQVPKIVFSSTAALYLASDELITEESLVSPSSVYGQTKKMAEEIIREFAQTKKIKSYVLLRYFNVAGDAGLDFKEDKAENVFPVLVRSIKNGTPFKIFGTDYATKDGTCIRDYIHLRDLVSAHIAAITKEVNGVFNLGTGMGYSVIEVVEKFRHESGVDFLIEEAPRRQGDLAVVVSDYQKANKYLAFEPQLGIGDMVSDTLRIYS
jgi:UDP-glucose 4-epimerase